MKDILQHWPNNCLANSPLPTSNESYKTNTFRIHRGIPILLTSYNNLQIEKNACHEDMTNDGLTMPH